MLSALLAPVSRPLLGRGLLFLCVFLWALDAAFVGVVLVLAAAL